MIENKHNIIYVNQRHFYKIDMDKRNYTLENTKPYTFSINDQHFKSNKWGRLVEEVSNYLIETYNPTREELINLSLEWTSQSLYIEERTLAAHLGPLINGLFINTNHTSTHLMWMLQDLLAKFNISMSDCQLLIKKSPKVEAIEINRYFINRKIEQLNEFLKVTEGFDENIILQLIKDIKVIDKVFKKRHESYVSILLFESKFTYAMIKTRFLKYLRKEIDNTKTLKRTTYILDILTKFYGTVYA